MRVKEESEKAGFKLNIQKNKDRGISCNAGDQGAIPWSERSSGERQQQSTPVFLPGEFHGQRSLAGYSPWGCKELDTTEGLTHTYYIQKSRTGLMGKIKPGEHGKKNSTTVSHLCVEKNL